MPLNLPGFPRSRAHTIGARCRLPSITVHGKALSLISGSQRGLHNCSKKPNQKANLRASKLHVTYQLGASAATELQAMHIYSSESRGGFSDRLKRGTVKPRQSLSKINKGRARLACNTRAHTSTRSPSVYIARDIHSLSRDHSCAIQVYWLDFVFFKQGRGRTW